MKAKLDSFEATGTMAAFGAKSLWSPQECDFTITRTDSMRTKINEQWVSALCPAKYQKIGGMRIWKGMYLISHSNEKPIVNSKRYLVTDVSHDMVTVEATDDEKKRPISLSGA